MLICFEFFLAPQLAAVICQIAILSLACFVALPFNISFA